MVTKFGYDNGKVGNIRNINSFFAFFLEKIIEKKISFFISEKPLKMLMLGFSSGLPILLVFSTLSVWLSKAGVARGTITLFSWAGFAYAFKFLWSPLVDKINISFFQRWAKEEVGY